MRVASLPPPSSDLSGLPVVSDAGICLLIACIFNEIISECFPSFNCSSHKFSSTSQLNDFLKFYNAMLQVYRFYPFSEPIPFFLTFILKY